ncbi:hypothetical protein JQ628_05000 [Bradyrhizobium lablabi]|uniref:hypothetical protein n=1 Tax=Bradyrhizobium lablabi TaxID=722472 RepID=UPI001BAD4BE5|nr:hypothetical protein [Bradyrhizobium lablabi]MBR1120866.1 hypothetical protein [Bradyrhizobium lablabi]
MTIDNDIGYEFAGKGAKRRQRLTLDTIPKRIAHYKPEYRLNRKPAKEEPVKVTERGMRRRITRYTLQLANVSEIHDRLDREAYGPGSKVMVASVRNHAMEVIKVMIDEGIISQDDLERYRKRCAKEDRERFKRRD